MKWTRTAPKEHRVIFSASEWSKLPAARTGETIHEILKRAGAKAAGVMCYDATVLPSIQFIVKVTDLEP